MVEGYRKTGQRLVAYARETGLFEVPADYRLDVMVTPPPLRSSIEGAAYYPAPPFKKSGVGRFYVTPTDDDVAQLRAEHNYAAMPDLAAHEGFPGHDWHYKIMTQYRDQIAPVRWLTPGPWRTPHPCGRTRWPRRAGGCTRKRCRLSRRRRPRNGFYTPEEHLYQLRGQLYRDLRVRIDTGIHTGRLSFEDAVSLFSQTVDFQARLLPGPAGAEVRGQGRQLQVARAAVTRYARWPTQAITYRLGKEQILALRKRAQQARGAHFSAQRFHLEFMKQGTIPAGYFGEELLRTLHARRPSKARAPRRGGLLGGELADEQVRGQHVERLELPPDVAEYALEVLHDALGELVQQEGAAGLKPAEVLRRIFSRSAAGMVLKGIPEMM